MLTQLVYISTATNPFSDEDLVELLKYARQHNIEKSITGMLLHKSGSFIQVLEGEEDAVNTLFDRILDDPRHYNIIKLTQRPVEAREFGDWSMAFRNISKLDLQKLEGYSPELEGALTSEHLPSSSSLAHEMLTAFKNAPHFLDY